MYIYVYIDIDVYLSIHLIFIRHVDMYIYIYIHIHSFYIWVIQERPVFDRFPSKHCLLCDQVPGLKHGEWGLRLLDLKQTMVSGKSNHGLKFPACKFLPNFGVEGPPFRGSKKPSSDPWGMPQLCVKTDESQCILGCNPGQLES